MLSSFLKVVEWSHLQWARVGVHRPRVLVAAFLASPSHRAELR